MKAASGHLGESSHKREGELLTLQGLPWTVMAAFPVEGATATMQVKCIIMRLEVTLG